VGQKESANKRFKQASPFDENNEKIINQYRDPTHSKAPLL